MTYTCLHSFESTTGHRYDKNDLIDLSEYKGLTIQDRSYFEPADQEHVFPIEEAI